MIAKLSECVKRQKANMFCKIYPLLPPDGYPALPLSLGVIICHAHVAKSRTRDLSPLLNLAEAALYTTNPCVLPALWQQVPMSVAGLVERSICSISATTIAPLVQLQTCCHWLFRLIRPQRWDHTGKRACEWEWLRCLHTFASAAFLQVCGGQQRGREVSRVQEHL